MPLNESVPTFASFARKCVVHWQVSTFVFAILSVLLVPLFLPSKGRYEKIYALEADKIRQYYILNDYVNTLKEGADFIARFPRNKFTGEIQGLMALTAYKQEFTGTMPSANALQTNLGMFESAIKNDFLAPEMSGAIMDSIEKIKDSGNPTQALAEFKRFQQYYPNERLFNLKIAECISLLPLPSFEKEEQTDAAVQERLDKIKKALAAYDKNAGVQEEIAKLLVEGSISENINRAGFDLNHAYTCYLNILELEKNNKTALLKIANLLIKTGNFADVIALLQPVLPRNSDKEAFPELSFALGLAYIGNNDYPNAYTCFEALLAGSRVPNEYQFLAALKLADIYFKNNLLEKSLELYESSFQKIKKLPAGRDDFIKDFRAKIDTTLPVTDSRQTLLRIMNTVEKLTSVDPSQDNYALLGRTYLNVSKLHEKEYGATIKSGITSDYMDLRNVTKRFYVKTAKAFINAYKAAPAAPASNIHLWSAGDSFYQAEAYSPAAGIFKQYIGTHFPLNRTEAYYKLGMCYQKLGQYGEAIKTFDENITFYPYTPPYGYMSYYEKAHSIMLSGNLDNAEQAFLNILSSSTLFSPLTPEWKLSIFKLGELYYKRALLQSTNFEKKTNDISSAVLTLSEAITRYKNDDPENTFSAYYQRAQSYALKQDWKNAIADYYNTIETGKSDGRDGIPIASYPGYSEMNRNSYFNIADAFFNLQDYANAANAYSMAWKKFNSQPEMLWALIQEAKCYYSLNRIADAQKNIELAMFAYEKFTNASPENANSPSFLRWKKELDDLILLIGGE